ncbi:centrosomal protein of 72 kDa [Ascaphus truei]|uniref:centrosomal protein of 72 kDa n=1 Tax=Ascaphus truei TaxID=8439 RepID=UPI003F5A1841
MEVARTKDLITFEDSQLQLYNDLSKRTVDRRKELRPLTILLRDSGVKYKWGFPFRLMVQRNGKMLSIKHQEDMEHFAKALNLTPPASWRNEGPRQEEPPTRASERLAGQRDDQPVRDNERKAALICYTTERAFELQDPSSAPGDIEKSVQPRATYIGSLSKKYSLLDDDDEAVLNLIAKCKWNLNNPLRITGSAKRDQEAELHSLQGIRLIDDGISCGKSRIPEDGLDSQPIKKKQANIPKKPVIQSENETALKVQQADEDQEILPKPSDWPTFNYKMKHIPTKDKNVLRVKFKRQHTYQQDPNFKFQDEAEACHKIISHAHFTPHPSTGDRRRETTIVQNGTNLERIGEMEGYLKSVPNKGCKEVLCAPEHMVSESVNHNQFKATAMEYLLDLVDKYWNGSKSLHSNETFLCHAKQVLSVMQHSSSSNDQQKESAAQLEKINNLVLETKSLHTQLSEQDHQNNVSIESLELQLNCAKKDMDIQKQQLDLVLQENNELKNMLLKIEKVKYTPDSSDPKLHDLRTPDLQSHNHQLQQEIDALKCQLQHFDKFQKLTEMLQESHRYEKNCVQFKK